MLVAPQNPEALARALARLLIDPQEREGWRKRAAENLDWLHVDRFAHETLDVYTEALHETMSLAAQRPAAPM